MLCVTAFTILCLTSLLVHGDEVETKFLIPSKSIFKAGFDDGQNPGKPNCNFANPLGQRGKGLVKESTQVATAPSFDFTRKRTAEFCRKITS